MRSSTRRAAPVASRETRLRDAGLSGARALSRLLVALFESLGQHDKAGRRYEPGWPHGTVRSAFGPTPLGNEVARMMAAAPPAPEMAPRDVAQGVAMSRPRHPEPTPPPPTPAAAPTPVKHPPFVAEPARTNRPQPAPKAVVPADPLSAMPAWQRPFIAAPGVRYMRTPDHLLRRARDAETPIMPIEPDLPKAETEEDIGCDDATPEMELDTPAATGDEGAGLDDWTTLFDIDDTDEDVLLNIEDQAVLGPRPVLARRLSMTSGFAVDVPSPANDLTPAERIAIAMAAAAPAPAKQPFAVNVRAKPKARAAPVPAAIEVAPDASARVTLATTPAPATPTSRRAAPTIEYELPSVELLGEMRKPEGTALTADMLEQNARLLETTLEDFGIRGEIIHVRAGPVVTLYELEPAPGMKSSRVIGLADDIARSMSALSARVAVVPGRNAIGIELPNERRETVYFREMVECAEFDDSKHKLAIALGKTIGGEPVIAELAKMPHLLVAGTTGSGKSVAINTMILSLLYRLRPDECRLIMVDPKMLELSVYDGIPHLLTPVVTDPKKAVVALKWAVREMEDRYKKMSKLGVRNIDGFNARITQAKANGETITIQMTTGFDRETGKPVIEDVPLELVKLPYIVVIVDEMADLMMVAGKDIEGAIQRLAQMARAAGIHLIMATQRPSVDVITGTIKANFPTRISFQVTSKIDSRTILGEQGAEQLLGQGDMLHMQGGGRIYRVHGPFVSDEEVERVVAHLKRQGTPDYLDSVTDDIEVEAAATEDDEDDEDAVFDKTAMGGEEDGTLYEQAVKIVLRDKKSSVSYVQRRLQVGYNKAASLIERMEKEGVLGPASHTGKREILAHGRGRVISGVPGGED